MKILQVALIGALVSAPLLATAQSDKPSSADQALMGSMQKMNSAMNVTMTGNPDSDFVRMMVPHHQGAIDMAEVELRYGHDPKMLKLARAIVEAQKAEIVEMKAWLAQHGR